METDPYNIDQHAPGAKLDTSKPDASLLLMFGRALAAVAEVGTFGAQKYTRGGWREVPEGVNRYTAALGRHLLKEDREAHDQDSGLLHAAHAAWNALARLEMMLEPQGREHVTGAEMKPFDLDALRAETKAGRYWYLATPYSKYPGGPEPACHEACKAAAWLIRHDVRCYCPIAHTHPIAGLPEHLLHHPVAEGEDRSRDRGF